MRRTCLLLAALALSACGFDDPPVPAADPVVSAPAVPAAPAADPCTEVALTLLDGQLNGLPSAEPSSFDKGARVADQFQQRYDAVIAGAGVEAARTTYAKQIQAACAG